jgi:uncharacterized membrane protein YeaQ/YmgE (transglycosylase-associated protein family)
LQALPARVSWARLQRPERCMHYVWMAIVGFVVGLIARALLPGTQKLGLILTAVLGIAGSFIAGFVGQALGWYEAGEGAGFIGSIVGAIVLLFIWSKVQASGSDTPTT